MRSQAYVHTHTPPPQVLIDPLLSTIRPPPRVYTGVCVLWVYMQVGSTRFFVFTNILGFDYLFQ